MIHEITIKTALHYHDRKIATNYDLNIYRGCEHKCQYCFAQYSQQYLESDFFNDIFVKTNIAEVLDKELSKKNWKFAPINISGVSDCYQPLEEQYKIMSDVLKVLIKHKNPAIIITKSNLILRDIELIEQLSNVTNVVVGVSINSINPDINKKLEPNVASGLERFKILKEISKLKNCKTMTMLMPIIPYLTDNKDNLEQIYKLSKEYNVLHITPAPLHLRGCLKTNFYNFLEKEFPFCYKNIQHLYKSAYVSKQYSNNLQQYLSQLKRKYGLYSLNCDELNIDVEQQAINDQPTLFD